MGEMIVAYDLRHGLKANQQFSRDGFRRMDTALWRLPLDLSVDGQASFILVATIVVTLLRPGML